MPNPIMKKINIYIVVKRAVDFIKMSSQNIIELDSSDQKLIVTGDEEQLYRVFINLIKNSEESFSEKREKKHDFKGKINIEIVKNNDYIVIKLIDNGTGILDTKKVMTPYFTTKKKGSGLGLPIVSKIINEHSGELNISNNTKEGATITILLPFKS